MTSPGFRTPGDRKPRDQTVSDPHNLDIDKATELWRKQFESRANPGVQVKQSTAIEGGLPPHLLFKNPTSNPQRSTDSNDQAHTREAPAERSIPRSLLFQPPNDVFPAVNQGSDPEVRGSTRLQRAFSKQEPQISHGMPLRPQVDLRQFRSSFMKLQQTNDLGSYGKSQNAHRPSGREYDAQQQQLHSAPNYEEHNTQSHMFHEADIGENYHQQSQTVRQPFDAANSGLGVIPTSERKFQAKKSCDRESQSLPETVSSVKSMGSGNIENQKSSSDVRQVGRGPVHSHLGPSMNNEGSKDEHSDSEKHSNGKTSSDACQKWVDDLIHFPICLSIVQKIDRHYECDVEPINGFLMAPVDYPETHINPLDKSSGEEALRRLNGTAGLKSLADFEKRRRLIQPAKKHEDGANSRDAYEQWPGWQANPPIFADKLPPTQPPTSPGRQGQTTTENLHNGRDIPGDTQSPEKSEVPKSWFLRPVQEEDLPQILKIYNWEVVNGIQALDNEPLILKDVQRILAHCRAGQTPFIVAIAGTPAEAAARKEIPAHPRAYQVQRIGQYSHLIGPDHPSYQIPELDKILGFGFLNISVPGLAGNVQHSVCRFQARTHVYVHAKHRRNGIGRSLLHKLTRCCSIYSVDMGTYEWFDPSNSRVCDLPGFNPRNYSCLLVETASRSENDPDTIWYSKFLDSEGFVCISASEKTRKIGHGEDGQWLDNLVWQLDCQDFKTIMENNQNPYNL